MKEATIPKSSECVSEILDDDKKRKLPTLIVRKYRKMHCCLLMVKNKHMHNLKLQAIKKHGQSIPEGLRAGYINWGKS